jgi:hypothetical protein
VLNLVAQPDKKLYIGSFCRIVGSKVLLNARRKLPSLPIPFDQLEVPTVGFFSVERLHPALEKDSMIKGGPRDAHQNYEATGPKARSGSIVGLDRE